MEILCGGEVIGCIRYGLVFYAIEASSRLRKQQDNQPRKEVSDCRENAGMHADIRMLATAICISLSAPSGKYAGQAWHVV